MLTGVGSTTEKGNRIKSLFYFDDGLSFPEYSTV